MHEYGDVCIILCNPQGFEICQGLAHARHGQATHPAQLVGGDALFLRRVDNMLHDGGKVLAPTFGDLGGCKDFADLLHTPYPQRGWKNLHPVFFAVQKVRFFQPSHGCLYPRIVSIAVPLEIPFFLLVNDLTGGGDNFAIPSGPSVKAPKRFQDRADLMLRKPRPRAEVELSIHVFRIEQKNAACRFAVPSRAPRLL